MKTYLVIYLMTTGLIHVPFDTPQQCEAALTAVEADYANGTLDAKDTLKVYCDTGEE